MTTTMTKPALDVLAEQLRQHLAAAERNIAQTVEAMIEVGEDLIAARKLVPSGGLNDWAKEAAGMHPKTVTTYVRFATHAELLRQHQPSGTLAARKLLASVSAPRINSAEAIRLEAQRLKKQGHTQQQIAETLQISRPRVSQLLNADTHRQRNAKQQRERQEAARALARQRQAKQVKKSSNPSAAEAYSLTRKALQELDRAYASTPTAKHKYLRLAMEALYRAEDNIALAVNTD